MTTHTKICTKCNKNLPFNQFFRDRRGRNGLRANCKQCCLQQVAAIYHKNNAPFKRKDKKFYNGIREYISSLKRKPCENCGREAPPCAMDFDHKPGTIKLANVSSLRSKRKIDTEISKCSILCVICHRIKTKAQKSRVQNNKYFEARSFIEALKNNPCRDCEQKYPPEAMDFDHLRDKSRRVSSMLSASKARIMIEVSKCDLVCAVCHAIRTHERRYN